MAPNTWKEWHKCDLSITQNYFRSFKYKVDFKNYSQFTKGHRLDTNKYSKWRERMTWLRFKEWPKWFGSNIFQNNMKERTNSDLNILILLPKIRYFSQNYFEPKSSSVIRVHNTFPEGPNTPNVHRFPLELASWFFWNSIEFLFGLWFQTKSENRSQVHIFLPIVCWKIKTSRCIWIFSHAWFTRVYECNDCVCAYHTAYCTWSVIHSQSPISISLVSF